MFQLWAVRVDGGHGKEIYGEDYADVYAMTRIHFLATTNDTCDHVSFRLLWLHRLSGRGGSENGDVCGQLRSDDRKMRAWIADRQLRLRASAQNNGKTLSDQGRDRRE